MAVSQSVGRGPAFPGSIEVPADFNLATHWRHCSRPGRQRCDGTHHRLGCPFGVPRDRRIGAVAREAAPPGEGVAPSADPVGVVVRNARGVEDYRQLARLRAEAYYEETRSRFVQSFKTKFARQEAESLTSRTTTKPTGYPGTVCLVATDGDASVVGGLDVRLPRTLSGDHPEGVPTEDGSGCFVVNVVVDENRRGQGIGGELMRAAVSMATDWGATNAYTHVDATNTAALNLYSKYGFKEVSCVDALDSTATLGKTLLLKRPMQQVA
ncbi:unnamed protein product [Ostreobium quekettii]|uniref:N-acetyltransferase domain-containing protein n=1 Tax=Ostreobium quekettii TaxID=121088 RepID=A0A8S1J3C2_9CHLO|nr:unnamed protein product [Ostreobium quekettii]